MPYKIPTLPELIAQAHKNIQSKIPDANTSLKNSELGALAYNQGAMIAGVYHYAKWISKQVVPHLADHDQFLAYAREAGIARKPASIAKGTVTVKALDQVTIPKGTKIQRNDGAVYQTTEEIKDAGDLTLPIQSNEAGLNFNCPKDTVLRFITPIFKVDNSVVVEELQGGANIEPIAEVIERYLYRFQYPPMGGNQFDYVRWLREMPGVTRAWCYKRIYGYNTVGIAWVYDDRYDPDNPDAILPTHGDIVEGLNYILSHKDPVTNIEIGAPLGAEPIFIPLTIKPINPVIEIYPNNEEIQASITRLLNTTIKAESMPNGAIPRSHLTQAISNAAGEYDHRLISPTIKQDPIKSSEFELITLGEITFRTLEAW